MAASELGFLAALLDRFRSNRSRVRRDARNWLEMADRVWHYRRDLLNESEARLLLSRRDALRRSLKEGADAARLKLGIGELEAAMRRVGGETYPKGGLAENVEFLMVAAIVILGIRAYFVQPFEIPTNSMWPTYYGMTAVTYLPEGRSLPPTRMAGTTVRYLPASQEPGALSRIFRLGALGAIPHTVSAPCDGEVSALFTSSLYLDAVRVDGRTLLVIPADQNEFTLYVDGQPVPVRMPADFSVEEFTQMVIRSHFGSQEAFLDYLEKLRATGQRPEMAQDALGRAGYRVPLGRTVKAGEPILRFDLLTGDKLFVDRISYHFVRPSVGDGFVFRTVNIPGIGMDQYYIKRLVGRPGDTLQVRPPVLYRNGAPITGARAFTLNASRTAPYRGYFNGEAAVGAHYLREGEKLTVADHAYFGMGDNSGNSLDGRYWGFIPEKDVAGRPLFIYYPFSRRWGPAR